MEDQQNPRVVQRIIEIDAVHSNLNSQVLEITIDRLKIVLLENEKNMSEAGEWKTPLALLLTIVLVLCTTGFKDSLGLKANVWEAVFLISALLSAGWLVFSFTKLKHRVRVDQLIELLKKIIKAGSCVPRFVGSLRCSRWAGSAQTRFAQTSAACSARRCASRHGRRGMKTGVPSPRDSS